MMDSYASQPTEFYQKHVAGPRVVLEQRLTAEQVGDLQRPPFKLRLFVQNTSPQTLNDIVDYGALAKRAEKLHLEKKDKETLAILQPYENDPNNNSYDFFNIIGIAYRYNNDHEKAEKAYLRAIEINPLGPHARVNLGILYLKGLKDRKKAEEQFLFVINNIDPNNRPANFYLKAMKEGRF